MPWFFFFLFAATTHPHPHFAFHLGDLARAPVTWLSQGLAQGMTGNAAIITVR
jgi:hypothetical protein